MSTPPPAAVAFCCCLLMLAVAAGSRPAAGEAASTAAPADVDSPARIGQIFPPDNPWNLDISGLPVHPSSATFIAAIGASGHLYADFGTYWRGRPIGLPFNLVRREQPHLPVSFEYASESDPGPYPIPPDALIEGGPSSDGDRHVIVLDVDSRKLYELYAFRARTTGGWDAVSGAIFALDSNALRPAGWTSADAAGLPILPGLVRYDEAGIAGVIPHALRFTVERTQRAYIAPARHFASPSKNPNLPPMGLRLRLKASVDVSSFSPPLRAILTALQRYGMFVADNGSNWFISGTHDRRWNDDDLATISRISGNDFEVVDTGPIVRDW
jgi:hypothetical protein